MKNSENVFEFFANEENYPDLDIRGAAERLGAAIRCRTVTSADEAPFLEIHDLIRAGYPSLQSRCSFEVIGRSILMRIEGKDPALLPALFMAHMDVVPVIPGTEEKWTYPAFSGEIADGYIWGRGTLDIKEMVFGELEAIEYLLAHGRRPERTIYLAFGQDEETIGSGAEAIAAVLQERGVKLAFLLDEGCGDISDGAPYGAPGTFLSFINTMEKGYADLELSVKSAGGHSSRPFGGTSLAVLAEAISSITKNPFPAELPPVMRDTFRALAPYITVEPLKTLVKDIEGNSAAIAEYCMHMPELFPQVTTTIAPTMIHGSSAACNVMPQDMDAEINFRIASGYTPEYVMEYCRNVIHDDRVALRYRTANPPSAIAKIDCEGYEKLVETMSRYYQDVVFVPLATAGSTDARMYEQVCDSCLRCTPFLSPQSDTHAGIHGTNERIAVRSYAQGIRVLISYMEKTCF